MTDRTLLVCPGQRDTESEGELVSYWRTAVDSHWTNQNSGCYEANKGKHWDWLEGAHLACWEF